MADTSPSACRNSTMVDLWAGSTRANRRAFLTARAFSSLGKSSNSRPVKAIPSVFSFSPNTPIRRQIASAVAYAHKPLNNSMLNIHVTIEYVSKLSYCTAHELTLLSPVMTITRIPAPLQSLIESMTSARGGSNIPTTPTNVQLVSYLINLLLSSRSISSFFGGLSMVASARQRSVSRPETKVYADVLWITGRNLVFIT